MNPIRALEIVSFDHPKEVHTFPKGKLGLRTLRSPAEKETARRSGTRRAVSM